MGILLWRVEQDARLPGGLLQGMVHVLCHLFGILVEQRVMLHNQEAVVVLLLDGLEEALVALLVEVDALGLGQHLHKDEFR
jgi:hypothetical protein